MVNKAILSLAAVVLFAVFGTGVLVGMLVGGPGGGPAEPAATETAQPGGTPAGTDAPATATPGSESTATPADDDGAEELADRPEPIPAREFNERNISAAIAENINDAREAEGLSRLSTGGATAENVRQMAKSHSDNMADVGLVRHTIDGDSSSDRYRQNDLYNTCQFQVESYIESADNNALEVVGRTYAGQQYPDNGTQAFNENDTAVANALTDDWLSTQLFRERLTYRNADEIGVGVTVTRAGTVYATVNVC